MIFNVSSWPLELDVLLQVLLSEHELVCVQILYMSEHLFYHTCMSSIATVTARFIQTFYCYSLFMNCVIQQISCSISLHSSLACKILICYDVMNFILSIVYSSFSNSASSLYNSNTSLSEKNPFRSDTESAERYDNTSIHK